MSTLYSASKNKPKTEDIPIVAFSDVSDHFQTSGKMHNGWVGQINIHLGSSPKSCWHFLQFSRSVRSTPHICHKRHPTCAILHTVQFYDCNIIHNLCSFVQLSLSIWKRDMKYFNIYEMVAMERISEMVEMEQK